RDFHVTGVQTCALPISWSLLLATVCIGAMGALGPILQSHLMDVAGEAQTLAAASHHAAFNAANALGPLLGGMAISAGFGWTSTEIGRASCRERGWRCVW